MGVSWRHISLQWVMTFWAVLGQSLSSFLLVKICQLKKSCDLFAATWRIMWEVGSFCEAFARLGTCIGCGTHLVSKIRCPSSLCAATGPWQRPLPPSVLCRFQQALPGSFHQRLFMVFLCESLSCSHGPYSKILSVVSCRTRAGMDNVPAALISCFLHDFPIGQSFIHFIFSTGGLDDCTS